MGWESISIGCGPGTGESEWENPLLAYSWFSQFYQGLQVSALAHSEWKGKTKANTKTTCVAKDFLYHQLKKKKTSQVTHLCKIASHLSFLSLITLLWLPSFISISGGIECLLLLSPDYLIFDNDLLSSIEKLPSLYVDCFLLSSTPAKILQLLLCKLN